MRVGRSLPRLLPAEGKPQKLKAARTALGHLGFLFVERQTFGLQPTVQPLIESATFSWV